MRPVHTVSVLIATLSLLAGCGEGGNVDHALTGKSLRYAPGDPSFDLECVPVAVGGQTEIAVYVQIPGTYLMFVRAGGHYEATMTVIVRVLDPESGDLVHERAWAETVAVGSYAATQSYPPVRFRRLFPAPHGRYVVEALLEDRNTGKEARRGQSVVVPEFVEGRPTAGSLMLERVVAGVPEPTVVFHVPRAGDTLLASAQLFNVPPGSIYDYDFTLRRFVVDTAAAPPPYSFSVPANTMEGRRLYPEFVDTLLFTQSTVVYSPDMPDFRLVLPPLGEGMYQMTLRIWGRAQAHTNDSGAFVHRFFAIMNQTFPRPSFLDDLVAAAVYIADGDEWTAMDTASTPSEKLKAFDAFWLSLGKTPEQASALVRKYYSRIEEANRLFSTFKEGWRTDRGMVYTILGPPERVDRLFDQETWYFHHPGSYQENTWRFRRVYFAPDNLSMEDFLLVRGRSYEYLWQRILKKWREGVVY